MRIRFCNNGNRAFRRIPVTHQQPDRVVTVGQPFTHALGTGLVDADHAERRTAHARTVVPTARTYSASASSAT
jgi:hypothetical protein